MGVFEPVGLTDSEYAFCYLINQLYQKYPQKPNNDIEVFSCIKQCADKLSQLGVFNMLLSDGQYVFAYCSTNLHWITRKAPFGKAKLLDEDVEIDFHKHTTPNDIVTIISTLPLTSNETWFKLNTGEAILFNKGEINQFSSF